MSKPNYVHLILRSWRQVVLMTLLGLVCALAFSLVQPLRYSSTVRLFIVQTNSTGLDPYTAIKSTERIAQNLTELIYTTAFYNAVVDDPSVDRSYFPTDEISRREKWRGTIEGEVSPGTGVMSLIAYHTDRSQAQTLSVRAAQQLAIQASDYFGFSVRVQVIDSPLPSRFFAKPDFASNALFGATAGLLLGLAWVLGRRE